VIWTWNIEFLFFFRGLGFWWYHDRFDQRESQRSTMSRGFHSRWFSTYYTTGWEGLLLLSSMSKTSFNSWL
jgi:hypothetical protein